MNIQKVMVAHGRSFTRALLFAMTVFIATGCRKIPLREDYGSSDLGVVHWYEHEKVAYLFWTINEDQRRFVNPVWTISYVSESSAGGDEVHPEEELQLAKGVHEHRPGSCGGQRVCMSYSFVSERPLRQVKVRFFYDAEQPLSLDISLTVQNHKADPVASAYSVLPYGVFDETNTRVEIRTMDNFGTPNSEDVAKFGLTRIYRAGAAALFDASAEAIADSRNKTASAYLFPNNFCQGKGGSGTSVIFNQSDWNTASLDGRDGSSGACFDFEVLDRFGKPLFTKPAAIFARKNPILQDQTGLKYATPLKAVVQIPVVVTVCPDDPFSASMTDESFLNYQKFVLGISGRPTDVCFRTGSDGQFASRLKSHLAARLTEARSKAVDTRDFLFVILLHDRFSNEFLSISRTVAEEAHQLAAPEELRLSPRLLGAFVYGSSVNFQPNSTQRPRVLWCPQSLIPEILRPDAALADQNCLTTNALELDLRVINFVAPLGPLPSRDNYSKYVSDYGDTGLTRDPVLKFSSVPYDENTQMENDLRVTYFASQKYTLGQGELARVCPERLGFLGLSTRVRKADASQDVTGVTLYEASSLWLSGNGQGEYLLGMAWDFPFVGGISYKGTLSGKVIGMVPYQRSFQSYERLGDSKWQDAEWDFGAMIQKCVKYCDHPFFDEKGTYQVNMMWRDETLGTCPKPAPPKYGGAKV